MITFFVLDLHLNDCSSFLFLTFKRKLQSTHLFYWEKNSVISGSITLCLCKVWNLNWRTRCMTFACWLTRRCALKYFASEFQGPSVQLRTLILISWSQFITDLYKTKHTLMSTKLKIKIKNFPSRLKTFWIEDLGRHYLWDFMSEKSKY